MRRAPARCQAPCARQAHANGILTFLLTDTGRARRQSWTLRPRRSTIDDTQIQRSGSVVQRQAKLLVRSDSPSGGLMLATGEAWALGGEAAYLHGGEWAQTSMFPHTLLQSRLGFVARECARSFSPPLPRPWTSRRVPARPGPPRGVPSGQAAGPRGNHPRTVPGWETSRSGWV